MLCPFWGDGSLWGDGDLWCRAFGTLPRITEVDRNFHRVSVKVNYSGAGDFRVDSVRPNIDYGRSLQDWTHTSTIDREQLSFISVKVNFSANTSFKVHTVIPEVNIKGQRPVTHVADTDIHTVAYVSVRFNYSTASSMLVNRIIPEVTVKKHQPVE